MWIDRKKVASKKIDGENDLANVSLNNGKN